VTEKGKGGVYPAKVWDAAEGEKGSFVINIADAFQIKPPDS